MRSQRCGNLEYVPFIESPHGPAYEPRYDSSEAFADIIDSGSVYFSNSGPASHQFVPSSVAVAEKVERVDEHNAVTEGVQPKITASPLDAFSKDKVFRVANQNSHNIWLHRSLILAERYFSACFSQPYIVCTGGDRFNQPHRRINKEV